MCPVHSLSRSLTICLHLHGPAVERRKGCWSEAGATQAPHLEFEPASLGTHCKVPFRRTGSDLGRSLGYCLKLHQESSLTQQRLEGGEGLDLPCWASVSLCMASVLAFRAHPGKDSLHAWCNVLYLTKFYTKREVYHKQSYFIFTLPFQIGQKTYPQRKDNPRTFKNLVEMSNFSFQVSDGVLSYLR